MNDLAGLVKAATHGDNHAFAQIIRMFQDMAYGYAYSLLGDFHLAQDAAQEAFIEAYYNLKRLEKPEAFPGWFRRIVQFKCNRFLRRKQLPQVPLTEAFVNKASDEPGPHELVERQEMKDSILNGINNLKQPLREVTTLFYINGYSHNDISEFLEVPVTTVKSRLNTSREMLQRSMRNMIRETFGDNRLPGDFGKNIIKNVPKPFVDKLNYNMSSFSASLCSCLEMLGEKYNKKEVQGLWGMGTSPVQINELYTLLSAVTGIAFGLNWNPEWDYYCSDIMCLTNQPYESIERAFEAVGYDYEIIGNRHHKDSFLFEHTEDYEYFKKRIIESIQEKHRPLIAFGVISTMPPCCVITGYDKAGDVLTGWSLFQFEPRYRNQDIEYESCGYFRQKDWFENTRGIILIGEKHEKPPPEKIYRKALEWAVTLFRSKAINNGKKTGLDAYDAMIYTLKKDDNFIAENKQNLFFSYLALYVTIRLFLYEGRGYAVCFLKEVVKIKPELHADVDKAVDCYESIVKIIDQVNDSVLNSKTEVEILGMLVNPEIRGTFTETIIKIRDLDSKAIGFVEKVLKAF